MNESSPEAYRRIYVNLDDFVDRLQVWVPQPRKPAAVKARYPNGSAGVTRRHGDWNGHNHKDRSAISRRRSLGQVLVQAGQGHC